MSIQRSIPTRRRIRSHVEIKSRFIRMQRKNRTIRVATRVNADPRATLGGLQVQKDCRRTLLGHGWGH